MLEGTRSIFLPREPSNGSEKCWYCHEVCDSLATGASVVATGKPQKDRLQDWMMVLFSFVVPLISENALNAFKFPLVVSHYVSKCPSSFNT